MGLPGEAQASSAAASAANVAVILRRGPEDVIARNRREWLHNLTIPPELARFHSRIGTVQAGVLAKLPEPDATSTGRLQPISMAAHGFEQGLAVRRVDLAAEPRDINIDDIGERILAIAPHLVENARPGEDAAWRAH